MRRLLPLAFALLLGVPVHAQRADSARVQHVLFGLEDEWPQALIKRDPAVFRRLLAPAYVYTDDRGVFTKEQVIADNTAGSDTVTASSNESMKAYLYGNTAIVVGLLIVKGHSPDGPFDRRYRFTDTWMKREGRWQCVALHDAC